MTANLPPTMRALKATYDEAKGGREAAEQLKPLLALLEPPEAEGGPLEEITVILTAILDGQAHTLHAIEALSRKLDAIGDIRT